MGITNLKVEQEYQLGRIFNLFLLNINVKI